ncbi:hypothetical protein, partial [Lacrimispora amygdalina]|uniref:hypothetical protein n=1 Tax=Lacrimispora amygdalina TaxID=253257 RepID=UPI0031F99B17
KQLVNEANYKVDNLQFNEFYILSKGKTKKFGGKKFYWYCSEAKGYTDKLSEAGQFNKLEVKKHICPYNWVELSTKCVAIPISIVKKLFDADKIVADDEAYLKLDQNMKFIIGDLNWDCSDSLMS